MNKCFKHLKIKDCYKSSMIVFVSIVSLLISIMCSIQVINNDTESRQSINTNELELEIRQSDQYIFDKLMTTEFTLFISGTNQIINTEYTIDLIDLMNNINSYLKTTKNQVKTILFIGGKLYIVEDTTMKVQNQQKANIVSLNDNIKHSDWVKAIESIYSNNKIVTGGLITANSEFGNTHYIYIYESN